MRIFLFLLAIIGSAIAGNLGNVDSTITADQRMRNLLAVGTFVPPYTWMDTVNIAANYGVPDSIKVLEMRMLKPGVYQMKLNRSGIRSYTADSCDILRVDLDSLYTAGTTAGCRTGSVTLWGIRE